MAATDRPQHSPSSPSFSSLLLLLSSASPSSSPSSHRRLLDALTALTPFLLRPFAAFPPLSRSSSSTTSPSALSLHPDWLALLTSFSTAADVELAAATSLLQLHLLSSPSSSSATFPSLSSLLSFYRTERLASLEVVAALFRCGLDPSHPLHSASRAFTDRWVREEGEQWLIDCLRSASATEAQGEEAADQSVREQLLMLDVLFLCHYDAEEPSAARAQAERGSGGGEVVGSRASMAERVMGVVSLLYDRSLMTAQASYLRLSAHGRLMVQRLRCLSVLLLLETLQLGRLRVIVDHPAFALQEEAGRQRWLSLRPGGGVAAAGAESKERDEAELRREAERGSVDVQEEVESLLFADATLLAHMDAALTSPSSPLADPLLLLAWAVLLSLLLDLHEELSSLQRVYDLPLSSPPSPLLTRSTLLQRLQSAFSFSSPPFALARSLLSSRSPLPFALAARGMGEESASGYREIFNELLTALCASSLYPWLTSASASTSTSTSSSTSVIEEGRGGAAVNAPLLPHEEVVSVFVLVMGNDNDLAYRWWEAQHVGDLEQPLLTEALALFPHSLSLLSLLTAVAGQRGQRRVRLRADGLSEDIADEATTRTERDAQICAAQVYRTLLTLHTYTTAALPSSHCTTTPPQSSAALAGWTLRTTSATVTVDGVVLPAGAFGRPLRGGLVQWRVEWSGWAGLISRMESLVLHSRCSQGRVEWEQLHSIVRIIAKLLTNHPALGRELQGHISQQRKAPAVDLNSLLCRALLLLAATQSPSTAAPDGEADAQLRLGLLHSITGALRAAAECDLVELTRSIHITFLPSAAATTTTPLHLLSAPSITFASHSAQSLLHTVQSLHSSIERVAGAYPLTLLLLHLVHLWTPHFHLAHLHLNRPPPSPASFHTAASLPSSASTLTTFASLDLALLSRFICSEVFVACEGWSFAGSKERSGVLNGCLRLFLVTLGHSLPMAADRLIAGTVGPDAALQSSLFRLLTRDAAMQRALLAPLIAALSSREAAWAAPGRAEAEEVNDLILHTLLTVHQLLRIEKSREGRDEEAEEEGEGEALHSAPLSLHWALLQPAAFSSTTGSAASPLCSSAALLASFDSHAASRSPQSAVQAIALLVDPTYPASIQHTALSVLTLLSTPLHSARASLFPCLTPVLSPMRRCLLRLLSPRHPPPGQSQPAVAVAIFHLLAALVRHQPTIADLLLQADIGNASHAREEDREEKGERTARAAAGGGRGGDGGGEGAAAVAEHPSESPLVSAVLQRIRAAPSLFTSAPRTLSAVLSLLCSVWSHPTPPLVISFLQPLLRGGELWESLRFVLAQPTQPMPRQRPSRPTAPANETEEKAKWRPHRQEEEEEEEKAKEMHLPPVQVEEKEVEANEGAADEEGGGGAGDGVDVSASVQLCAEQVAIQASALRLLAVEVYQQALPSSSSPSSAAASLPSFLSSALSGPELRRWLLDFTACEDDCGERAAVAECGLRLRVDVEGLRNQRDGVSPEDDRKGRYLLEVAHRLLYDDLIAKATASTALITGPAGPQERGAQSFGSTSTYSGLYPPPSSPALRSPSPPAPPSSPLSIEEQRSVMSTFLTGIARVNDALYLSERQLRLTEAFHLLLHSLLYVASELVLPPAPSLSPLLVLDALTSSISSTRDYEGSAARQAALAGSTRLLLTLLHHLLAAQPSRAQLLSSAAVREEEERRGLSLSVQSQLLAVHARVSGWLERIIAALLYACQRGLSHHNAQLLREQLQAIGTHRLTTPMEGLTSTRQQPTGSQPFAASHSPTSSPSLSSALQSLLLCAALLSRYALHVRALLMDSRSSPAPQRPQPNHVGGERAGREVGSSSSSSSSSSSVRSLPRPLSFPSPARPLGAGTAAVRLSLNPVMESGEEELVERRGDGEEMEATAAVEVDLHLTLLAVLCTTAREPQLQHDSIARIPLLHQLIQEREEQGQVGQPHPAQPPRSLRCVSVVSSLVVPLLDCWSSLQWASAAAAASLLRLFEAVADSAGGALLLQSAGILQRLSQQPTLRRATIDRLDSSTSSLAYLPSGERDGWHLVWCQSMNLASLLLLRLPPTPSTLHSVCHFLLFYRIRMHWALQRTQQRRLSLGHLEEVSATVRLVAEVGRRLIRQAEGGQGAVHAAAEEVELLTELRAMALTVTEEFVHLLMDSRLLEERSVAISEEERRTTASPHRQPSAPAMGGAPHAQQPTEDERRRSRGQGRGERSEGEEAQGEQKERQSGDRRAQRLWRPLGRGAGTAPPTPLPPSSALRSPSRSPLPSSTLPGAGALPDDVDAQRSGERGRKRGATASTTSASAASGAAAASVFIPGPPALHAASFLLRSPVVSAMQRPWPRVGPSADGLFTVWSTSSSAAPLECSLLVPRVEWCLCSILRVSLPFLLECSGARGALQGRGGRALLSYRSRIVDVQPIVGGGVGVKEREAQLQRKEMERWEAEEEYADLTQTDDAYDGLSGLGDAQQSSPSQPATSSSRAAAVLSASPFAPSLLYRPPVSMMVDLCRYCLHLLIRLAAVQPLLLQQLHAHQPTGTCPAAVAMAGPAGPSSPSFASLPSLAVVVVHLQSLLEQSLLLLSQQAERHLHALLQLATQLHRTASAQQRPPQGQHSSAAAAPAWPFAVPSPSSSLSPSSSPLSSAWSAGLPSSAASPSLSMESPALVACGRVLGVLEAYRERLQGLCEEVGRLLAVRSGVQLERRRSALSPRSPNTATGAGSGGGGGGVADRERSRRSAVSPASSAVGSTAAVSGISRARESLTQLIAEVEQHALHHHTTARA